jgi:hypothetical protein
MTNLQKEMSSLNKRSKDNYSDLMSLKDATSTRDEDIRKTLHDLVSGLETKFTSLDSRLLSAPDGNRSGPNLGLYLDDKAHNTTPGRKSFGLPRIGSPSGLSMALDRELTASPSLACVDGAASIALLEKVLREMATRDGQDTIISTLEAVKSQVIVRAQSTGTTQATIDPIMMSKLEDILMFMRDMKEGSGSRALVRSGAGEESRVSIQGSDILNEEVVKLLKNVKQSLSQGGGLTNEVKVLVRDLRGEVLGMGREIARKLEQAQSITNSTTSNTETLGRDDVASIVHQGLAELKEHMQQTVLENIPKVPEQTRPSVDAEKVLLAVQSAIAAIARPREEPTRDHTADREDLLAAVREAWEDCKPEIALEHFGLERDEILETLKEGLKSYQAEQSSPKVTGASYEEVLEAVHKGMANFKLPEISGNAWKISSGQVYLLFNHQKAVSLKTRFQMQ